MLLSSSRCIKGYQRVMEVNAERDMGRKPNRLSLNPDRVTTIDLAPNKCNAGYRQYVWVNIFVM